MFDPLIHLNQHIALLHLRDDLAQDMERQRGIARAAARGVGRMVMDELVRSRETLRANKMYVDDRPLRDGRYRYTYMGRSTTHEISPDTLELYKGMAMGDISKRLERKREEMLK